RDRFWGEGMPQDKVNAYMTLYTVLVQLIKLCAPMLPFMTEDIYLNLVRNVYPDAPESVHLCDFPAADESMIDPDLEDKMEHVLKIVVLGRSARNDAAIKNRQPLSRMFVKSDLKLEGYFTDVIRDELNVGSVEFTDDTSAFTTYSFKPQLRTLGRKFGKNIGRVKEYLAALTGAEAAAAMRNLKETGTMDIVLDGVATPVTEEDLLIEIARMPGFDTQEDGGITVVLDITLTPELIEAGNVRELTSKVQALRKEAGFEVTDHIRLYVAGNDDVAALARRNAETICGDTLTDALLTVPADAEAIEEGAYVKELDINGSVVTVGVKQIGK
ncbi:MAG: class I tRNA ligase family protein, partial [Clostridia bacterium]|nr:class I tRNA ligase family protein [Clostridia bacterium]